MILDLLSSTSRVETPFIIATIGGCTFGAYSKEAKNVIESNRAHEELIAQYPNYMQSLSIVKINGALNTYTLVMRYMIRDGDDPNLLEKVFSAASNDRRIVLSYGDMSIPSYIYKEEEAIITKIRSSMDINSSTITYTIDCVSQALALTAGSFSFPKRRAKPSDVIKELLYNNRYGLIDIFYGMRDKDLVLSKGLLVSDDKVVDIEAKKHISVLDYLNYLVNCMSNISDIGTQLLKKNKYVLVVCDDLTGTWGGPYFKIVKVTNKLKSINSLNTYEIDIGYPGTSMVTSFSLEDDETYSILYNYSSKVKQSDYTYRINNKGEVEQVYSPTLASSASLMKMTEADRTWWSQVTQYPITATLTVKGLLKPSILMSYIKLNVLYYGRKHISSGYYIITKQTDTVDASGYKTTLKLTRISGDDGQW